MNEREVLSFAKKLSPNVGPNFGSDVTRVINALQFEIAQLEAKVADSDWCLKEETERRRALEIRLNGVSDH